MMPLSIQIQGLQRR